MRCVTQISTRFTYYLHTVATVPRPMDHSSGSFQFIVINICKFPVPAFLRRDNHYGTVTVLADRPLCAVEHVCSPVSGVSTSQAFVPAPSAPSAACRAKFFIIIIFRRQRAKPFIPVQIRRDRLGFVIDFMRCIAYRRLYCADFAPHP
jgi:hypothetical protein